MFNWWLRESLFYKLRCISRVCFKLKRQHDYGQWNKSGSYRGASRLWKNKLSLALPSSSFHWLECELRRAGVSFSQPQGDLKNERDSERMKRWGARSSRDPTEAGIESLLHCRPLPISWLCVTYWGTGRWELPCLSCSYIASITETPKVTPEHITI